MKYFNTILLFALLVFVNNAIAVKRIEYTDEGPVIAFHLSKDLTGYIKTRSCDSCKVRMYKITPDVKAVLDGKEVPLSNFILSGHKPVGAHFSVETKKMTRIVWSSRR